MNEGVKRETWSVKREDVRRGIGNVRGREAMKGARKKLGRLGENLAADHLERRGYVIRQRNYRCPVGEMDIVVEDGDCLVFVEVRTRRGREYGTPEESITVAKKAKLVEVAQTYLQEHDWPGDWRIDVVAVELTRGGRLERVTVIQNAVGG
jgi:putative endonuclease